MKRRIYELTFTARPEHIDQLGHVNNAVRVQWEIIDRASGRPIRVPAEVVAPFPGAE